MTERNGIRKSTNTHSRKEKLSTSPGGSRGGATRRRRVGPATVGSLMAALLACSVTKTSSARSPRFGLEWVRNHGLTVFGGPIKDPRFSAYFTEGMNALLDSETAVDPNTTQYPVFAAHPGTFLHMGWLNSANPTASQNSQAALLRTSTLDTAFIYEDELFVSALQCVVNPQSKLCPDHIQIPYSTVYSGTFDSTTRKQYLDARIPRSVFLGPSDLNVDAYGITAAQNMNTTAVAKRQVGTDVLNRFAPDILMFDEYPFNSVNQDNSDDFWYFNRHMAELVDTDAPGHARAWETPWFAAVQAFGSVSESQLSKQVYVALASGAKGIDYFVDTGMPAPWDAPSNGMASAISGINSELARFGPYLRYLTKRILPSDVLTIDGHLRQLIFGGIWDSTLNGGTPPWAHLPKWTPTLNGNTMLASVSVQGPAGDRTQAIMSTMFDETGTEYLMVVSNNGLANQSSSATTMNVVLTFNNTLNQVYRINRNTGAIETLPLVNHVLTVAIPGGKGELFSTSPFKLPLYRTTLQINSGATSTSDALVQLSMPAQNEKDGTRPTSMRISSLLFGSPARKQSGWIPYSSAASWNLGCATNEVLATPTTFLVKIEFKDGAGNLSAPWYQQIDLTSNPAHCATSSRALISSGLYSVSDLGSAVSNWDAKCQTEFGCKFKAMVVNGSTRKASVTPLTGDGQVNWVLRPNTPYVRSDGKLIFWTDASALWGVSNRKFVDLENSIRPLGSDGWPVDGYGAWSGIKFDWTAGQNCVGWTSTSPSSSVGADSIFPDLARFQSGYPDSFLYNGGSQTCAYPDHILCVEQAACGN